MFVAPKQGVVVLDFHTRRPVPTTGQEVPETAYWMRRLRDGDLVAAEPPAPVPAEPSAPAPAPAPAPDHQ